VADCIGLENCSQSTSSLDTTIYQFGTSDKAKNSDENVLASCLALLARKSPDLALLVERWNDLPEAVRAGIAAMVKAADPQSRA
jgi:hypothetical protein